MFVNNSFVTDLWKSDATDVWSGHVGLLNWSSRPMDDHLVRHFTFGHCHFPFNQPVGAGVELELVRDQSEDLSVFLIIRASTQAHLD